MLSVGIITYNEELRIVQTLEAIKDLADEIVIIDSFSTDRTIEIAKSYGANILQIEWPGYGQQKNNVIKNCKGDWILLIDADEVVTPELAQEIKKKITTNEYKLYSIPFYSVCFGKVIKFGGWSSTKKLRLLKKGTGKYSLNTVHESYITTEKIGTLKSPIKHYSYDSYSDYLNKFNRYTSEGALQALKKNKSAGLFNIVINPMFKFLRMYIFRLGFLDGIEGLALATLSALYTSVKYLKLREMRYRKK